MFKSTKAKDLFTYFTWIAILIALNFVASQYTFRYDLTADKKFTISESTKSMLKSIDQKVFVEVYLEGEFPSGFERLQKAIKETLDEFTVYSNDQIEYRFINPASDPDPRKRNQVFNTIAKRGLQPTNLTVAEGNEQVEKIIFPGAIVIVKDKEIPVTLLKGNQVTSAAVRLNQSVEGVEFELANAIKMATAPGKRKIGFLTGYSHIDTTEMEDLAASLKTFYAIELVNLRRAIRLDNLDAIIMAKPDTFISEQDKFKLDQYLVNGGRILLFMDGMNATLDSIKQAGTISIPYSTNLDDWLFKCGIRINPDLIMDLNSGVLPMVVGIVGDKPKTSLVPWRYFPIINNFGSHPTVKNMDALYTKFASTLDTIKADGIKKTPLLFTSKYSRIVASPVRLNFNEARLKPLPQQYSKSFLPVSFLLEGKFTSLYKNRIVPEAAERLQFHEQYKAGKLLVVSDGDFIRNDVSKTSRTRFPLGYDRFSRVTFANKDFVMNLLAYMLDDKGVILAKNKVIQLRPLDKIRIENEKLSWQIINIAGPNLLILIAFFIRQYQRKRKYASFK